MCVCVSNSEACGNIQCWWWSNNEIIMLHINKYYLLLCSHVRAFRSTLKCQKRWPIDRTIFLGTTAQFFRNHAARQQIKLIFFSICTNFFHYNTRHTKIRAEKKLDRKFFNWNEFPECDDRNRFVTPQAIRRRIHHISPDRWKKERDILVASCRLIHYNCHGMAERRKKKFNLHHLMATDGWWSDWFCQNVLHTKYIHIDMSAKATGKSLYTRFGMPKICERKFDGTQLRCITHFPSDLKC